MIVNDGRFFAMVLSAVVTLAASCAGAEEPFMEPASYPFDVQPSTATLYLDRPSLFVEQLSRRMEWPVDKLYKLESSGYARTEMILLVMMKKKTGENWDELVKEREKGAALRAMAEKRGMPYYYFFRLAQMTKDEIDAAVQALPA